MSVKADIGSSAQDNHPFAPAPVAIDVDRFWRDGFLVIRGAFDPTEIHNFRSLVEIGGRHPDSDLLSDPKLRALLLDPRIVEWARRILGGRPVYFGDSSVWYGLQTRPGFHKDCADKNDPAAPDWQGQYPLIRFGVYAQDHSRSPDGLDLRRGSHDKCNVTEGEHVYAATRVGDVVVWNMRTSHSGGSVMLKMGRLPLNPAGLAARLLRKASLGMLAQHPEKRMAFFMSYGLAGRHVDRYVTYLRTRRYAVDGWRASPYDQVALAMAEAVGVDVIDMHEAIKADPPSPREDHRPLPY